MQSEHGTNTALPQPPGQHFVCCGICRVSCPASHVRFSHDILFSRKCPRQDSNKKRVTADKVMPCHSALKTLEGHPLTSSGAQVLLGTHFPLITFTRWADGRVSLRKEEAGESFCLTPAFSSFESQSSLTSFYTRAVHVLPRGELGVKPWSARAVAHS